jgi:hypothetical protein
MRKIVGRSAVRATEMAGRSWFAIERPTTGRANPLRTATISRTVTRLWTVLLGFATVHVSMQC